MRGEDQRSEVLFSYVRLESRIPADDPLRAIRALVDEALTGLSRDFNKLYARDGRPSIPPAVAGAAAASVLHGALGTAVDGAAQLQSVVPVVRRSLGGRSGVECDGVLQEPGSAARR